MKEVQVVVWPLLWTMKTKIIRDEFAVQVINSKSLCVKYRVATITWKLRHIYVKNWIAFILITYLAVEWDGEQEM